MSTSRPRPSMAVVGAAVAAVLAPAAPAVAGTAPAVPAGTVARADTPQHCTTEALTLEQLRAGQRSQVRCSPTFAEAMAAAGVAVPADAPLADQQRAALASSSVLAIHYDGTGGIGSTMSVTGTTCDGGGISFTSTDAWNDRIRSTRHQLCTKVKHWVDAGYAGASQLTDGPSGSVHNMNGTLAGTVSSMRYW